MYTKNMNFSPFTEMPEELKRGRFSFGRLVRGFFNFLLLLILGLALFGLVFAFAYRLIHNPEALGAWASSLIVTVEGFIRSLAAVLQ